MDNIHYTKNLFFLEFYSKKVYQNERCSVHENIVLSKLEMNSR